MSAAVSHPTHVVEERFVLRVMPDRQPSQEIPLRAGVPVIVGRGLDADIRIADGLTSRRHAQFTIFGRDVVVEDFESTNGTLVNNQKVRRAVVKAGDRVTIGVTNIELVVTATPVREISPAAPTVRFTDFPATTTAPAPAPAAPAPAESTKLFAGSVAELPIADLLQLLHHTNKSGILVVRAGNDTGKIYIQEGEVTAATINGSCAKEPKRTLYRLLRWQKGTFELQPAGLEPMRNDINEVTDSLLLEAAWQHDELKQLEAMLPAFETRLRMANPLPGPLPDLSPGEQTLCKLIMKHTHLLAVLDHFEGSDYEACIDLVSLMQREYIVTG
jgi:hypothetical protein